MSTGRLLLRTVASTRLLTLFPRVLPEDLSACPRVLAPGKDGYTAVVSQTCTLPASVSLRELQESVPAVYSATAVPLSLSSRAQNSQQWVAAEHAGLAPVHAHALQSMQRSQLTG